MRYTHIEPEVVPSAKFSASSGWNGRLTKVVATGLLYAYDPETCSMYVDIIICSCATVIGVQTSVCMYVYVRACVCSGVLKLSYLICS